MIEDLSDEELLAEWEKTKATAGSASGRAWSPSYILGSSAPTAHGC
jgi:hypothetical protein